MMKKLLFRLLYGKGVRFTPMMHLKLRHYFGVFLLMRKMQNHFVTGNEMQLLAYWEGVYRNKIYFLLKDKCKEIGFEDENH